MNPAELGAHIQHTLYEMGTGPSDLERHCQECIDHGFNAAMVPARYVREAVAHLAGSGIPVVTAVDFPLGMGTGAGRVAEARAAVAAGAAQLDLAVPIGLIRDGRTEEFAQSIAEVVTAVTPVPIKVMLELPLLERDTAELAVRIAVDAGAKWLKNASSGMVGAATEVDIAFLRAAAPSSVRIKASGAIHSAEQVAALIGAGADLVGTSTGVAIVNGELASQGSY